MKSLYVTIPYDYNQRGAFFPKECEYNRTNNDRQEGTLWTVERYDFDGAYEEEVRQNLNNNIYVKDYQIL